jgi:hypothetical protein
VQLSPAVPADEQPHRKRGRDSESDRERRQHGQNVGDAQGTEEAACYPRKGENWKEYQEDREGRVYDSGTHLEDGIKHDASLRPWLRQLAVLAQPAHDVFDTDHRVVDHFADGDRKAAQRHGVERFARPLQSEYRGDQ